MKPRRLVLVVMIDALGHRIVRENGFLEGLVRDPKPVKTIFGYSSSAIPSLLTGVLPQEHGHFAMYLRDRRRSVFRKHRWMIRIIGEWLGREWFLRRRLSERLRADGVEGYFSLYEIPARLFCEWDLCQKKNLFLPDPIPGFPTIFDRMLKEGVPYKVWEWSVPDERAETELVSAVREGKDAFLLYYTSSMDSVMHAHGTRGDPTRRRLRELDQLIRALVSEGQTSYGEVRLFVFGDHGMADVVASHDLWSLLPNPGPPGRRGTLYFLDSTMARFWFDSPSDERRVREILDEQDYGRVLTEEEEKTLGVYYPDRKYGQTLFLADEGHVIVPSFMGKESMAGMHGYHPDDPDSDTTLLTNTDAPSPEDVRGFAEILLDEAVAATAARGT